MDRFRHNAFFIGANVRKAVSEGRADYTPIFLSEIPDLIRRRRPTQVALLQLSPPDKHGFCSMGIQVDIQRAALEKSTLVIAEVNPNMPRTFGAADVHLSQIDYIVETSNPILELPLPEPDETAVRIGVLIRYATTRGIEGFYAEILGSNAAMLGLHKSLGHTVRWSPESGTYYAEYMFTEPDAGPLPPSTSSATSSA